MLVTAQRRLALGLHLELDYELTREETQAIVSDVEASVARERGLNGDGGGRKGRVFDELCFSEMEDRGTWL
eukprot:COSAG01_NODE_9354_length_2472_cov_1.749263_2_plen_71_part_00